MRFLLSTLALLPSAALADTILVNTRVAEVTMHPEAAAIQRTASVDIPEGRHQLVLMGVPLSAEPETLTVALDGAKVRSVTYREDFAPPQDYSSTEVEAAKKAVQAIEDKIRAVHDDAEKAGVAAHAAKTSIGFLEALGQNEGLANASPDALRDIARMIEEETATANETILSAQIKARQIKKQLETLHDELDIAKAALRAVSLETEDRLFVTLDVEATQAGATSVTMKYLVEHSTQWSPLYDLRLETQNAPQVVINRDAAVWQETGENWTDITLHLTTIPAIGQLEATHVPARLRRIGDGMAAQGKRMISSDMVLSDSYDSPVMAEPVVEEAMSLSTVVASGIGVTYTFADPVSIASGADMLRLSLDALTLEAELIAAASPRFDETAFRVASVTNTTGEDLLPSDWATRYVDGSVTGSDYFDGAVPGESFEIGFGPIKGLRLTRDVLDKSQGDRGIISRSNETSEQVEITVENLTDDVWPIRLQDRVPYSEQEDLEINWTAKPQPSATNVENQRGILEWTKDVKPGETFKIRVDTKLSWPEGMHLE